MEAELGRCGRDREAERLVEPVSGIPPIPGVIAIAERRGSHVPRPGVWSVRYEWAPPHRSEAGYPILAVAPWSCADTAGVEPLAEARDFWVSCYAPPAFGRGPDCRRRTHDWSPYRPGACVETRIEPTALQLSAGLPGRHASCPYALALDAALAYVGADAIHCDVDGVYMRAEFPSLLWPLSEPLRWRLPAAANLWIERFDRLRRRRDGSHLVGLSAPPPVTIRIPERLARAARGR